jgi:hypothetical protein
MVDFTDSFRRGLDAAKRAQANRDQIAAIFSQLSEALLSMTDGSVEIAVVPIEDTMNALARMIVSIEKEKYGDKVIAVRRSGQPKSTARRIARWKQGDAGYPCAVIWGERHASCEDADSLRAELAELVSSPTVGEAIVATMNAHPSTDA